MKKVLIALAILIGIVGWVVGSGYLAGILYFVLNKSFKTLANVTPITWLQYYVYYPELHQVLKKAMIVALFLSTLLPAFAALMIFSKKSRKLHGEARFARLSEIRGAGFLEKADNRSLLLGKVGKQYLSFQGPEFAFLAAPTRRGKGVGCVIPNLLHYTDSVVVLDIKGENFRATAGFRQKYGQEVYLFNPFAEDGCTHRYNPMGYIRNDENLRITDIQEIAHILYPTGKSQDSFFDEQARNLFMALALYLCETPELPRTLGELFRQSSGNGTGSLADYFKDLIKKRAADNRPLSYACVQAFSRFLALGEKTLASVKGSFDAPLLPFASPLVDAATSFNDFDFKDLRRKQMSIYIAISPRKLAESPLLINLFFSQLISQNLDELPENNKELKYECLLLMDEFAAIGKITIISKAVSFMAGYGLRLFPIFQNTSQITSIYGNDDARSLLSNHAVQIVYTPNDQRDAEDYSKMLGFNTEHGTSKSKSKNGRSETVSDQRRALLLPQEIKELPLDKVIICSPNCKPIMATKIRYYDDPDFKKRLFSPPIIPKIDLFSFQNSIKTIYVPPSPPPSTDDDAFFDAFIKNYEAQSTGKNKSNDTEGLASLASAKNSKKFGNQKSDKISLPEPLDEAERQAIERALDDAPRYEKVEGKNVLSDETFFSKENLGSRFSPLDFYDYDDERKGKTST